MKGFYFDVSPQQLPACQALFSNFVKEVDVELAPFSVGRLVYDAERIVADTTVSIDDATLVLSGWFVFRGQLNPLDSLLHALENEGESVLANIEIGAFLLLWHSNGSLKLITDGFGLHPHYIDVNAHTLRMAPSVKALVTPSHQIDPLMQEILDKRQYLFGNYTLYTGIERLEPGAVTEFVLAENGINQGQVRQYYTLADNTVKTQELHKYVNKIADCWPVSQRLLPISAGLDSRFILAHGKFGCGFTYGPEGTPERTIGEALAGGYDDYQGYDYTEPQTTDLIRQATDEIAFGQMVTVPGLLANYLHVAKRFPHAKTFFDGYLGDTLQRGTFITFKGPLGEIFKLFPWVYRFRFTAKWLLRKRAGNISQAAFELMFNDFIRRTADLDLDAYQKLTWYEFIYGRGGRYAVSGSNLMTSQLFTTVSYFTHSDVFNSLIRQDFADGVSYRMLAPLWQAAPDQFRHQKTESGYSPTTPAWLIPPIQLAYRLAFHFIPGRENYGVALKKAEKNRKA